MVRDFEKSMQYAELCIRTCNNISNTRNYKIFDAFNTKTDSVYFKLIYDGLFYSCRVVNDYMCIYCPRFRHMLYKGKIKCETFFEFMNAGNNVLLEDEDTFVI